MNKSVSVGDVFCSTTPFSTNVVAFFVILSVNDEECEVFGRMLFAQKGFVYPTKNPYDWWSNHKYLGNIAEIGGLT